MKRSPVVKLSAAGIVNNFHRLTWEEQGAYVRLLAILASSGDTIPDDDQLCRQMGGSSTDWSRVKSSLIAKGQIASVRGSLINSGGGVS